MVAMTVNDRRAAAQHEAAGERPHREPDATGKHRQADKRSPRCSQPALVAIAHRPVPGPRTHRHEDALLPSLPPTHRSPAMRCSRWTTSLLASLAAAAALCSPHSARAHFTPGSVATLSIHTVAAGEGRVTLPDRRSATGAPLAECRFTYATSEGGEARRKAEREKAESEAAAAAAAAANSASASTPRPVTIPSVLSELSGACITSTSDYWSYELCFGRHFKQFHGADIYMLGRGSGSAVELVDAGKAFVMEGGDICAALSPPKPRRVKIGMSCKANARTPQIMSISESSTCVYEIMVASDKLCSDPSWPVLTAEPPSMQQAAQPNFGGANLATALDAGSEDWFVEMVELEGALDESGSSSSGAGAGAALAVRPEPLVMCVAYSLEYRATTAQKLRFDSFELRITKLQGSSTSNRNDIQQLPPAYRTPTARMPGRVDVEAANLKAGYGSLAFDGSTVTPGYEGTLSYIKVYA